MARSKRRKVAEEGSDSDPDPALLELARHIRAEIVRVGDEGGDGEDLLKALDAVPREQRLAMARDAYSDLPAEARWAALERVFDDDDLRQALAEARAGTIRRSARRSRCRDLVGPGAAREDPLDLSRLDGGLRLSLGLFAEADVAGALPRGRASATAARRIDLRGEGQGWFQVVADVFNPDGGYFVTRAYDEDRWRRERLLPHSSVAVGSIRPTTSGDAFEPVLLPGGRVDFRHGDRLRPGSLHLGYLVCEDLDVLIERDES